jgi:hypothetical protein
MPEEWKGNDAQLEKSCQHNESAKFRCSSMTFIFYLERKHHHIPVYRLHFSRPRGVESLSAILRVGLSASTDTDRSAVIARDCWNYCYIKLLIK